MEIPYRRTKSGISIEIKVQPRSSRKGIDRVEGGVLRVKLTAPPAEGAANDQLIAVLSDALGISKSRIRIIRGQTSRNKVVEVEGIDGI